MSDIYKEKKDEPTISDRIGDVWVFNPDQMGEQGLMETLVGRKEYIREVCAWLRENKGKAPERHRLFYGRRGTGKTTLLLAIYYTILREQDLRDGFLPVKFAEDTGHMPFENTFIKETYDSLEKVADRLGIKEHFKKHAWTSNIEALSSFAKKTGRPFVFFIDNLHVFVKAVLESRGKKKGAVDEGSFLTQLLNRPEFLVVGASLEKLPREKRKKHPINLIWARFELQPLSGLDSVREATELMEKRADHDKEMEVLRHLKRYTGRIRGVFRLSDGNPRYLVMLYKLLRRHDFEGVQTDFNQIIDGLTGVIEGEMDRQITPKQKPVIKALCELGGRGKKQDVASRFMLPDETMDEALEDQIGNTLSELTNTDFVEREGKENGNQVYRTTPPLFQLWYEIRNLGRSHRIILLKIFDTFFPVPEQEITTAYRSFIDALQRTTPSDANFLGEALFYTSLTERPSAYFEDLKDLSRKVEAGGATNAVQILNEFEMTAHRLGRKDLQLSHQLLKNYSYLESGDMDKVTESIDEILKKRDPVVDPVLMGHTLKIKAETCLRREDFQSVLKHCDKALVLIKKLRLEERGKLEGSLYSLAGRAYLNLGEVENAKKRFATALKLHEKALDVANQISDMIAIGISFSHGGNYRGATDWFQRALDLSRDSEDLKGEARALQILSVSYSGMEEYDRAIEYGQEAVEKSREARDIEGEARALGNLAVVYGRMEDYDRAIEIGLEAVEKSREAENIEGEALALWNLADDYGREEDYDRAIEIGLEAVEKFREAQDIEGEARALRTLAVNYGRIEDYDRAIEIGQEAIEKSREAEDIEGKARALRNLAVDYGRAEDYDRAIEIGLEAVEKSREAKDIEGEARALWNLADDYSRAENYDRAIEIGLEAVERFREAQDIEGEARALRNLAVDYGRAEDYDRAIEIGLDAVEKSREAKDIEGEARALWNLADDYGRAEDYDRAIEVGLEAVEKFREAEDIEGETRALGNLAVDYGQAEDYDRAIEIGLEAVEKFREAEDIEGEARALRDLSVSYGGMEDYDHAIELGQEAVEKSREAKDIEGEARALRNLAVNYGRIEDYDRAIEIGLEAVKKSREAEDIEGEARALRNLAVNYGRAEDYDRAIEIGLEAVEKSREAEDIEGEARALGNLAVDYGQAEDYDRAIEIGLDAVEKFREARDIEGEAQALGNLAAHFGRRKDYISSKDNGLKALEIFRKIGNRENELVALRNIIQACYDLKEYKESIEVSDELENISAITEDEVHIHYANSMRFKCHLGLSRIAALEGNLPKAIEDLLSAGGFRDVIPPEELGHQLYTLIFRELLFEGKNEEVFEMTRLLKSWIIEELTPFIMALETASGSRLEPDKYTFRKLPPVERSMAYEFIRQAEGRKEAERAFALAKDGKYDEAMKILIEALDDSPDNLFLIRGAFLIAIQAEWWGKAEFYAREALSISEGDPVDLGNLGIALREKGEKNEALKFLDNAVNKGSTIFSHYNRLAILKEQEKDFDGAATAMQKALNLSLSPDETVTARHNLTEFLILLNRMIEAKNTLKPLKLDGLSPMQKTDNFFLLYLLSVLEQRQEVTAGILEDFCQNLIDHGEKAKSMFHFDNLLEYAQPKVGKKAKVLESWAEVAIGRIGINEFIQLFGTPKQKARAVSVWNDESGLALNRLTSGRIKTLADIEKTSTRENAVEIALDTYAAQHDELDPENQATSRRLTVEALKSEKTSVAKAGMESAGALFWRFKRLERKTVLTHLLEWARNESAPVIIRDAALRVIGALYFHLEKEEKETVIGDLRLLSEEYNPEPLRDLLDRIGYAKEENK